MNKQTVFGTAILISGPEGLLADRAVARRVTAARHERPESEVHQVLAGELEDNRFAELTGGSLFSASTVVVVQDLANLAQELFDAVLAAATSPGPDLALILVHGGGQKGKGLLDRLRKAQVEVTAAEAVKPWELPNFAMAEARRHKLSIDQPTAAELVRAVGNDLRSVAAAITQLASDLTGQVSVDDVHRYFSGRAEVTSFAVADDVMAGKAGEALVKLRWALATGVAPVLLTSALANSLRALGKYYDVRSARLRDAEVAREVGVPPFKVKELAHQSRQWTPRGVSSAIRAVATADAAVKGAAADPDWALERMLLDVLHARQLD